jgi:hypothetical protein
MNANFFKALLWRAACGTRVLPAEGDSPPIYGRNTLGEVCPDAMTYKKGGGGGGVGGAGDKAAWRCC